jgi:hypothetical protein
VTQPSRKSGSGCVDKIMSSRLCKHNKTVIKKKYSPASPAKNHVLLLGRPCKINVVNKVALERVSARLFRSHVNYDSTNVTNI